VLPAGRRFYFDALGTDPLQAIRTQARLADEPGPDPAQLAADEVLLRVRAANVGWVDLLMASGQYQHVPTLPYTPGLEFSGEVVATGPGVERWKVGDRVIADGLLTGPRSLGAHRGQGGFASYARAPAEALIPLPEGYNFDQGACLLGGAETAYHALVTRGRLQAGETALILGATGSTGLSAVALAKHLGARVIAVGRSLEKLAAAQHQGADHLVALGPNSPPLKEQVKLHTEGRGAELIYDPVGGPLSVEALRAAAFGARFIVVGWASTPTAGRGEHQPNQLPTNLILMKSLDVLGSPAAISAHKDPAMRAARLSAILAAAPALRPHVDVTFPMAQAQEALEAKWSGRHPGNVVLHPNE
jgi:NADPH2:quinone reductase